MTRVILISAFLMGLAGCAVVHQEDLDAWIDVPVVALDTHSFLVTLPMAKTVTESGVEIRVYSNKAGFTNCGGGGFGSINSSPGNSIAYQNFSSFQNCTSKLVGCDGVFYIRDGKVLEAKAVGRCYTNEKSRPEKGYERFIK